MAAQYYERNTSGMNADRFINKYDESPLNNMQRHYWTAKQFIRTKLGKKEDEHLEASDLELDTCLNLFKSVNDTSISLLSCVDNMCVDVLDETLVQNILGKYLKDKGKVDKNEVIGRSLIACGRALLFSSHQLNAARIPIATFFNKLGVFVERAIGDCAQTVEAVKMTRTEYRGSLLWMKKTSEELDPDVPGSMEKFREAQVNVRINKEKLDQLKMDTLQKVDLLSASRSNLLSYVLSHYQSKLFEYYSKTSKAYETLAANLNSFNNYEFEVLSHLLTGTSKKEQESTKPREVEPEPEPSEVKDLLFGRDSPVFEMATEDALEDGRDSPLVELIELQDSTPLKSTSSTSKYQIGPLLQLYDDSAPVPALNPPPTTSNTDWESFLETCHKQEDENLL